MWFRVHAGGNNHTTRTVVLMLDHRMEPSAAKDMIKGAADPLYSEFHLQYGMLLNMLL